MTQEEAIAKVFEFLEESSKKSPIDFDPEEDMDRKMALQALRDNLAIMRAVLKTISAQGVYLADQKVNRYYVQSHLKADRILQRKDLADLKNQKPFLLDSIIGSDFDIEMGILDDTLLDLEKFYGLVESEAIKAGQPDMPSGLLEWWNASREVFNDDLAEYEKKLVDYRQDILSDNTVLEYADLKLDLDAPTLQYKNNQPIIIKPRNDPELMLTALMERKGVVKYHELANRMSLRYRTDWKEDSKSEDDKNSLKTKKQQLIKILVSAGMTSGMASKYIKAVKNTGYCINPDYEKT